MSSTRAVSALSILLLAAGGCGFTPLTDQLPGGRTFVITVDNEGVAPMHLFVAEDTMPMGEVVGIVDPSTVPPGAKVEATFVVPPSGAWAIWVNPEKPGRGPMIIASDIPSSAVGKLPVTISVEVNSEESVTVPADLPGWFGN